MVTTKKLVKNLFVSTVIFVVAFSFSILFQTLNVGEHVSTIFVFAVFLISLLTEGCLFGIASAVLGMLAVNYAFTYPYFAFNFNISSNLISAIIMTSISVLTGMLTAKIKQYEAEKAENERERMRANLLRAMSHDLRTPLTTIYTASSTLRTKKELLSEQQKDTMLKNIEGDSQWLIRMVENLLSITRINNDGVEIAKTLSLCWTKVSNCFWRSNGGTHTAILLSFVTLIPSVLDHCHKSISRILRHSHTQGRGGQFPACRLLPARPGRYNWFCCASVLHRWPGT